MQIKKRYFAASAVTVLGLLATVAPSPLTTPASAATATYGPTWGQFSANFPTTPTQLVNSTEVASSFPKGTATEAYYISAAKDPFAKNSSSRVPTYIVVAAHVPKKDLASFKKSMTLQDGKNITVNGFHGQELLDSGTLSSQGTSINANSTPTEAAIEVIRGQVAFIVVAVLGSRTKATAFANSFKPST